MSGQVDEAGRAFELRPIRGEDVNGQTWVRIWDAQKHSPFAAGKVIAYTDLPTVVIEHANGEHSQWIASLPWERIGPVEPLADWEQELLRADRADLLARAVAAEAQVAAADEKVQEYRETTRDTIDSLYAAIDRAVEAETERDALAAQVAAIRAKAEEWAKRSAPNASSAYQDCRLDIRFVLGPPPLPPDPDNKEQP